jgi:hypothetical protein
MPGARRVMGKESQTAEIRVTGAGRTKTERTKTRKTRKKERPYKRITTKTRGHSEYIENVG